MTPPLVSVCVPTYNYGRFLPECLESVRRQTLADWELIVCDDGSTDDTAEIVRRSAKEDERIRYVLNERRLGMNGNFARVGQLARGRYMKILCADDWLAPNCLETLTALMDEHPRVALATSAEIHCEASGAPLFVQFLFGADVVTIPGEAMLDRMACGEGFGGNSSFFVRASAYRDVGGYNAAAHYAADYELAARLCRVGDYLHTDRPLFFGRRHPDASSSVDPARLLDVLDRFEIPERIFRPRRIGNREWRRYQRLRASLTARYLFNAALELSRGRHRYALELGRILNRHGNYWLGVPLLASHVPLRAYRRVRNHHLPARQPVPAVAGP